MSCQFKLMTSERDSLNKTKANKSSIEFNTPVINDKLSLVKAKITDRIHWIIHVSLPGESSYSRYYKRDI